MRRGKGGRQAPLLPADAAPGPGARNFRAIGPIRGLKFAAGFATLGRPTDPASPTCGGLGPTDPERRIWID